MLRITQNNWEMEEVMSKAFPNILLKKCKGYQKTMIIVRQLFIKENNF